jgi:hypothetical protein
MQGISVKRGKIARYGLFGVTIWLLLKATLGVSQTGAPLINLLDSKNGGQVILATSDDWLQTIDGSQNGKHLTGWAIYAFKDEQPATFDTFTVLIPGASNFNVKEFELLSGNDSPTGNFDSIGKFTTTNAKFIRSPHQEFKFPPVTAKYLKVELLSTWGGIAGWTPSIFQFRLFGRMKK